jgi:hypothetical protein
MARLPMRTWSAALLASAIAISPAMAQARPDPAKQAPSAIQDGLRWLARHQNPDGSWSASTLPERCQKDHPCFEKDLQRNDHYAEGITGLAVVCFLRNGLEPDSKVEFVDSAPEARFKAGDVVTRALGWLCARQNPDGSFTPKRPFLYNEAMATLAVVEAYARTRDARWKAPAQKGLDLLQDAQRPNPSGKGLWGWRYESRRDLEAKAKGPAGEKARKQLQEADISVTAWCVMALRAGQLAGLRVKTESMSGALDFCRWVTVEDGKVGYVDPETAGAKVVGPFSDEFRYHPSTMAAAGICIRKLASRATDDPVLKRSADWVVADLPTVTDERDTVDYYYWYYGTHALFLIDGPDNQRWAGKLWKSWNKAVLESVLALQDHSEGSCANGGWLQADRWCRYSGFGPLVGTVLGILILEIPASGR